MTETRAAISVENYLPDELYINVTAIDFFLNNQPDALIVLIYSLIKFYMFRASSLPIIRSSLLYHCRIYSRELLMVGREDARDM